jgi:hypothetical protein
LLWPFVDASPVRIREALTPEDAVAFDRHWRQVMQRATERLDLTEVFEALDAWRQGAWATTAHGAAVAWHQLKAELGLSE